MTIFTSRLFISFCRLVFLLIIIFASLDAVLAESIVETSSLTQEEKILDLESAITLTKATELAVKNNKEIQAKLATLPITESNLIIAKYRPNPTIASQNELATGGSLHPIQMALPIELGRKRFYRQEVAKAEIARTELEINKLIWETHIKVHPYYTSVVVLGDLLVLAQDRKEFYGKLNSIAKARHEAGDASKLDLDRSYLEVLASDNYVNEIEAKLSQARINLNQLLGLSPKQQTILEVEQEDLKPTEILSSKPEMQEYLNKALDKRIEVAILEKDYGIKRAQLKQSQWDKVPNLQVEAGVVHPSVGDPNWGPYLGVQAELPIFNRKQGEIKRAKAEIEYLDREKDRLDLSIKSEIENALFNFQTREKQLKRFEQNVLSQSQDILDSIQFGYKQGQLTLTDILNAEQKNREIRENYLQSILNYQIAFADLEYALGVDLDSLMKRN